MVSFCQLFFMHSDWKCSEFSMLLQFFLFTLSVNLFHIFFRMTMWKIPLKWFLRNCCIQQKMWLLRCYSFLAMFFINDTMPQSYDQIYNIFSLIGYKWNTSLFKYSIIWMWSSQMPYCMCAMDLFFINLIFFKCDCGCFFRLILYDSCRLLSLYYYAKMRKCLLHLLIV